jgi:large conductance mechanosensitive channel
MGLLREFREFALKGNLVELAVAFVLGVAFAAVVTSLVDDVIPTGASSPRSSRS